MSNQEINKNGIAIISYVELIDRFNYYGLQSLLVLYLSKQFGFADKQSYEIFGIYAALPLGLSILGGLIADRLIGLFYAALMGCLLVICGNLILIFQNLNCLYLGLATIMMGVGLLKPNNSNLLGDLFKENIFKREKAFSIFYLCINIGAILGPIVYGIFSQNINYFSCFYVSAAFVASALIMLFMIKRNFHIKKLSLNEILQFMVLVCSFIAISYMILVYSQYFGFVIAGVFFISALLLFRYTQKVNDEERYLIFFLLAPISGCIIYFACLQQIYSSLLMFIDNLVSGKILHLQIPVSSFSALEPFCLFLMVPILNWIWNKWSLEHEKKIIIGLITAAFSFLIFSMSAFCISRYSNLSVFLIIIGNVFLAIGELCTIPVAISLINLIAPSKHKGIYMGAFYFSLTLSGYFAGLIAQVSPVNKSQNEFGLYFLFIAGMLLVAGLIIYLINILQEKYRVKMLPR